MTSTSHLRPASSGRRIPQLQTCGALPRPSTFLFLVELLRLPPRLLFPRRPCRRDLGEHWFHTAARRKYSTPARSTRTWPVGNLDSRDQLCSSLVHRAGTRALSR